MKYKKLGDTALKFSSALLLEKLRTYSKLRAFTHKLAKRKHFYVAMRDGVRLETSVMFPDGPGPFPTLLVRNPYEFPVSMLLDILSVLFVRYGYAVVTQMTRGRSNSEGEWEPFVNEPNDGIDTVNWLRAQTWQDGNIGLFGVSYLGAVQWAFADELPPEVKCMVPVSFGTDLHNLIYHDGMFRHDLATAWYVMMRGKKVDMFVKKKFFDSMDGFSHALTYYEGFTHRSHWYEEYLQNPGKSDDFWTREIVERFHTMSERVHVPVMMITGWYDFCVKSALEDFDRLPSKDKSVLIMGPWNHLQGYREGDKSLPNQAGLGGHLPEILSWYDHHLKGKELTTETGVARLYEMGSGSWHNYKDWPPAIKPMTLYLNKTENYENVLSESPPEEENTLQYRYDPKKPVPTKGGDSLLGSMIVHPRSKKASSVLQPPPNYRHDVISFMSEPLGEDLRLSGSIKASLYIQTDAEDTCFTIKLMEVMQDGKTYNIRDTITSLGYRNGSDTRQAYEPGTPIKINLESWPIKWFLPAGSRLRLDVSSSNFPAYHAHPNKAEPWADVKEPVIANQTLIFSPENPMTLDLPVKVAED